MGLLGEWIVSADSLGTIWFNSWVGKIRWRSDRLPTPVFLGFPCGPAGKESACSVGDLGSRPGLGRCLGEGKGYPLRYSGLENSMDHGVAKTWTRLSDVHWDWVGLMWEEVDEGQGEGMEEEIRKQGKGTCKVGQRHRRWEYRAKIIWKETAQEAPLEVRVPCRIDTWGEEKIWRQVMCDYCLELDVPIWIKTVFESD